MSNFPRVFFQPSFNAAISIVFLLTAAALNHLTFLRKLNARKKHIFQKLLPFSFVGYK